MKRRTVVTGTTVLATAGCLATPERSNGNSTSESTSATDTPSVDPSIRLRNDLSMSVTARLEVTPSGGNSPVLDREVEVNADGHRSVTVESGTPPFRVAASMLDGPVESIFTHQWDATNTLLVRLRDSGVHFEQ